MHPIAADTLLRILGYSGLLLNIGATLSAILLLIAVASLPTTARQVYTRCSHGYPRKLFENREDHVTELTQRLLDGEGETYVLRAFGIARGWGIMLQHCIISFVGGTVCVFLHIGIGIWLAESNLVAAIVMPVAVFACVPPMVIFFQFMGSPSCHNCFEER